MSSAKHALVTGGAGFIGSHLVEQLLSEQWQVTVIDNFDPYYDRSIKVDNLEQCRRRGDFTFIEADIRHARALRDLPAGWDVIVHFAAKAGVRPSIQDPIAYQETNVCGTQNLLELAKERGVRQFVFASSSSVYGINPFVPWREDQSVLQPISPYASTKVSGELLGHVYSHLYGIRFLALRFFTVYGPRQRPDLAIHAFAKLILDGKPLRVFGDGTTRRDYTYAADVVSGIRAAMEYDRSSYEAVNLGNRRTVSLMEMIETLERALGRKATLEHLPEQPGDVPQTYADIGKAQQLLGYCPATSFPEGIQKFVEWLESAAVLRQQLPVG